MKLIFWAELYQPKCSMSKSCLLLVFEAYSKMEFMIMYEFYEINNDLVMTDYSAFVDQ